MRPVFAFLFAALVCVSPTIFGGKASALTPLTALPAQSSVRNAKFVCGDFGQGFTCKQEGGAVLRSGKTPKFPSSPSTESPQVTPNSGNSDALPSAPGDWGTSTSTQAPPAAPASCPANTELLGGHCVAYTQRCTNAIPPSAYPPQCRGEEKQVCNFHPDGSKDCCCRVYSKY
jgi:hypothetical protein